MDNAEVRRQLEIIRKGAVDLLPEDEFVRKLSKPIDER